MHPVRHAFHFMIIMLVVFFAPVSIMHSDAHDGFSRELIGGKTLMTFCGGQSDADFGLCNGYIMAVAEAMTTQQPVFGQRACGHAGVKAQQLVDLVRMDMADVPHLQTQPAGVMVAAVIARAFPCYDDYEPAAGMMAPGTIIAEPLDAPLR